MSQLEEQYRRRYDRFLKPISTKLELHLKEQLSSNVRVDRICTRPKSVERFIQKATKKEGGQLKYSDPLNQIYDQIGARIITFYLSDVPSMAEEVRRYFRPVENQMVAPESENEFGYVGEHFILLLPSDVLADIEGAPDVQFFELQIKTLFQHAWAEAEHDLGYKPTTELAPLQKRKMAFTAAQAWGADQIFDDLFKELHRQKS